MALSINILVGKAEQETVIKIKNKDGPSVLAWPTEVGVWPIEMGRLILGSLPVCMRSADFPFPLHISTPK